MSLHIPRKARWKREELIFIALMIGMSSAFSLTYTTWLHLSELYCLLQLSKETVTHHDRVSHLVTSLGHTLPPYETQPGVQAMKSKKISDRNVAYVTLH